MKRENEKDLKKEKSSQAQKLEIKSKADKALLKLAIENIHPNELYVINESDLTTLKFNGGQLPKIDKIVKEYNILLEKKSLQYELQYYVMQNIL